MNMGPGVEPGPWIFYSMPRSAARSPPGPSAFVHQPGFPLCLSFQLEILVARQLAGGCLRRSLYFLRRPAGPAPRTSGCLLGAPLGLQFLVPEKLAGSLLHAALELLGTSSH